jgi:hypothetical protein
MRKSERGMSSAPFIVTLVLFLLFVFLWYDAKSDKDKAQTENDQLKKQINNPEPKTGEVEGLNQHIGVLESKLNEITKVVGFATEKIPGKLDGLLTTNPVDVAKALDDKSGPFKDMRDASVVRVANQTYKPTKGGPTAANAPIIVLPAGFKDKVREAMAANPGSPPTPPVDADDAAAKAKYESDMRDWQEKQKRFQALVDEVVKMEGYREYSAVIGEQTLYDPDKAGTTEWTFWSRPASALTTLEEFVKLPAGIIRDIRQAYVDAVNSCRTMKEGDDKSIAELRKTIDNEDAAALGYKQQLAAEQQAHSADVARLQGETSAARADLERLRQSETTAQAALATEKEARKKEGERATQTITAFENARRENKEKYEIQIQRNEPDGTLLGVDAALGTGHIDLGSADKVYPGLVFEVSYVGRGGLRAKKGTVVIAKVLDAHYSQVRIVDQVLDERPMSRGDIIANPFYDKSKPMHVYLAGELRKYPKTIALDRLRRMGVVIDDAVGAQTDFIVVPDTMQVSPTPAAAGADAAGGAKEESQYDRLNRLAKQFGANLVTERGIEAFLDY